MKVGIYGGTFDPIHHGHLILARDAIEELRLDHLVFVPNNVSPHRIKHRTAPDRLRYEMVLAAIGGEPKFQADDTELKRGGVSYTFDTILAMKQKYPEGTELYYLIGQDNVEDLHTWHRIDELKLLVNFVVFQRSDLDAEHLLMKLKRRIDISATEVRERVAKGLSIRYLVPEAVRKIIADNQLYKESPHQI